MLSHRRKPNKHFYIPYYTIMSENNRLYWHTTKAGWIFKGLYPRQNDEIRHTWSCVNRKLWITKYVKLYQNNSRHWVTEDINAYTSMHCFPLWHWRSWLSIYFLFLVILSKVFLLSLLNVLPTSIDKRSLGMPCAVLFRPSCFQYILSVKLFKPYFLIIFPRHFNCLYLRLSMRKSIRQECVFFTELFQSINRGNSERVSSPAGICGWRPQS